MDFTLSEDLVELQALAATLFTDLGEGDGLWTELGRTGLLGLVVPDEHGGAGLGLDAVCVVLEEQGRRVAPAPIWPHLVATLTLVRYGAEHLLAGAADGSSRLSVALEEYDGAEPASPRCLARPTGSDDPLSGWELTGLKAVVPDPFGADHVLVSATAPDGPGVFLVPSAGLAWQPTGTTDLAAAGELVLDATPAQRLGGPEALTDVLRWARLALAAVQVGVAEGALRLAASYATGRHQFGRPIGSFQAVQHQLADCWIDVEAMRLTLWQALTCDADGRDAERAALVAGWWCGQGGLDVVHRVQHVHGGIGVDLDYPVHRHFLWGKQIASTLGGPEAALQHLGSLVAAGEAGS
ncbi:acyl-CoA dehydrogenase family protein [Nocardioides piscis]|uniref:Acyl-CoA/acyl-ACP dehydrogenase n=1 Tax=Nocardioides piscis TaxID=2714938 RepID=A0A6G7YHN1_9ACTN|nr:acyl-CoA dehydrogenase family protein [Nocardioides piscis]QIK76176.1 acyl-CoA/acyl-ACP dehydrogenase [Nocardioides piscis]